MYIDTHCHLDDNIFADAKAVVEEFNNLNVGYAINMGCNLSSSKKGKELSELFESVYFASGYHPSEVEGYNGEALNEIEMLLSHKKCVAVGEIGLDYHFLPFDKEKQLKCFISQLELAYKHKLPVSLHSRDATQDMINCLKDNKNILSYSGVMHCFSGSKETAKILLDLGFYIGIGGTVTFKNAVNAQEVAKYIPEDRILTETDSPYLSPQPFRGKVNTPKNIPIITEFIASLRNTSSEYLANKIMQNAKKLFYKLV